MIGQLSCQITINVWVISQASFKLFHNVSLNLFITHNSKAMIKFRRISLFLHLLILLEHSKQDTFDTYRSVKRKHGWNDFTSYITAQQNNKYLINWKNSYLYISYIQGKKSSISRNLFQSQYRLFSDISALRVRWAWWNTNFQFVSFDGITNIFDISIVSFMKW